MDDGTIHTASVDALIDDITEWLMGQALGDTNLTTMAAGTCDRLFAAGIPLLRAHFAFTVLHPLHGGQGFTWYRDGPSGEENYEHRPDGPSPQFMRSPQYFMMERRVMSLRRRLTGPRAQLDFPILEEFAAAGGTDYYAFLVQFGDSATDGIIGSWLTDREGGFTEEEIRALARIERSLGVALRMLVKTRLADNLVNTYLGTYAGQRVLQGQIRRGDGETLHAAVWYSDLRGSTEMAEALPGDAYIEILNSYFECMGEAIGNAGGQILDFVGDAVLAVFPVVGGGFTEKRACERALAAARDAAARWAAVNAEREAGGLSVLPYGLALHLGEVMFGNIGTPNRLTYSVVGSSVNQVSRLQDMTKELGRGLVVSGDFAERLSGEDWEDLGTHDLRGVKKPIRILAPGG